MDLYLRLAFWTGVLALVLAKNTYHSPVRSALKWVPAVGVCCVSVKYLGKAIGWWGPPLDPLRSLSIRGGGMRASGWGSSSSLFAEGFSFSYVYGNYFIIPHVSVILTIGRIHVSHDSWILRSSGGQKTESK